MKLIHKTMIKAAVVLLCSFFIYLAVMDVLVYLASSVTTDLPNTNFYNVIAPLLQ